MNKYKYITRLMMLCFTLTYASVVNAEEMTYEGCMKTCRDNFEECVKNSIDSPACAEKQADCSQDCTKQYPNQ